MLADDTAAHQVILEKDFAGIPKGSRLHISCPLEVAAELKTITPGSTMSVQAFRLTCRGSLKLDTGPVARSEPDTRRERIARWPMERVHGCTGVRDALAFCVTLPEGGSN